MANVMIMLKDISNLKLIDESRLEVYTNETDMINGGDPVFIVPELGPMHEFLTERYLDAEVNGIGAYDDSVWVLIKA